MSRPRFSKDYRTYGEWLKAQPRDTKYAKEIIRKHQFFLIEASINLETSE